MTVLYQDEYVTLHHANYRDHLIGLKADALICDPPYGETSLEWDTWPTGWLLDAAAISNALWCFGSFRMFHDHATEFAHTWKLSQEIVWQKQAGSGFQSDRFKRVHELASFWYRGDWAKIHHDPPLEQTGAPDKGRIIRRGKIAHLGKQGQVGWVDEGTRIKHSVIKVRNEHGRAIHPTQKPEGIIAPLIEYSVPTGGMVVDLFAGSGTTGVVARNLNRRAILFEAREDYARKAAERLAQQTFGVRGRMNWTLILPYPRPPKGLHSNDRVDWRVKARSAARLRDMVTLLCRTQHIPTMQRVSVQVVWVVPDKRKRDADGPDPMTKVIYDAIGSDRGTSAQLVPDDTPEFMHKPRLVIEHQPGVTAHFRVEITDVSNPFRPDCIQAITERI